MTKFLLLALQFVIDFSAVTFIAVYALNRYNEIGLTTQGDYLRLGVLVALLLLFSVMLGTKWGMGVYRKELDKKKDDLHYLIWGPRQDGSGDISLRQTGCCSGEETRKRVLKAIPGTIAVLVDKRDCPACHGRIS